MMDPIKELIRPIAERSSLYYSLRRSWQQARNPLFLAQWERSGRPSPPPHIVKQVALQQYAQQYGLKVFVETGTFLGDMVDALQDRFDKVYSIELSPELYARAQRRFHSYKHVELIQGDSGEVLGEVMKEIHSPTLFWLDGHYSHGVTAHGQNFTPIFQELTYIWAADDLAHVIVIDDARLFRRGLDYPTMEELERFISSAPSNRRFIVEDDMIRILPY